MKYLPFYLFTFLLFTLTGCIEEFEADIPDDESNLLVVEGTINSGKQSTFTLSFTEPIKGTSAPRWSMDAKVSVCGTDGSEYQAYQAEKSYGRYTCQVGELNADVEYYLHIELDGDVYESDPQKPLRTEKIADIRGVQETPESNISILLTPAEPLDNSKTNYYSWTYDETWEVRPEYTTVIAYDVEAQTSVVTGNLWPERGWRDQASETLMIGSSSSYEGQHIQQLKLYEISNQSQRMFFKYSSLVHQRAITKGEYEYEQARRQASEEMGGLFTPQPSALPSNVHCKTANKRAIGYIGCSLNTSDYRLFLVDKDFYIDRRAASSSLLPLDNPTPADCKRLVDAGMYLVDWSDDRMTGGPLKTTWAYRYQLDVTIYGCYLEKPDYWDLTENISY